MANVFIDENILQGWADTVREKTGTTDKMLPSALLQQTQENWGTGGDIQLIEGMEIAADFSAGDQSLSAPDGYAVKTATIKKPTTLVPENIADGVNIAGVVGTLESGGGGESSEWGLTEGFAFKDEVAANKGSMIWGASGNCNITVDLPADATDIYFSGVFKASAVSSSGSVLKEFYDITYVAGNPNEFTVTSNSNGRKTVKLFSKKYSYSGASYIYVNRDYRVSYKMPNVKIENNVLYANPSCEGLFYAASSSGLEHPFYMESVDLRGSNIQTLPWGCFSARPETKTIWLPESLVTIGGAAFSYSGTGATSVLEEIHFTSETPPSLYSNGVFDSVPTTCKFYVPAGTLSAYTSAANYPSASTYTYIEE